MDICNNSEGWGPISRLRPFDLTPCFEDGVLNPSLLIALVITASVSSFIHSRHHPLQLNPRSKWLLGTKLASLLLAMVVSLVQAGMVFLNPQLVPATLFYVLQPLAIMIVALLSCYNHTRFRNSSTILLLFWPAFFVTLSIRLRTWFESGRDTELVFAVTQATLITPLFVSYIIECLGPQNIDVEHDEKENPVIFANIYSRWSFGWMSPLMRKGAVQYITDEDLPSLRKRDESKNLQGELQRALEKRALWKALFVAYGGPYAFAAGLKVVQDCLAFLQPQLLRWLLAFISRYQAAHFGPGRNNISEPIPHALEGFFIAFIMFFASVTQTVTLNQYFQRTFETGMRVRAGLVTVIYAKALVLSNDERTRSSGDIVNLMSVDATRLQDLCTYGLIAISGPLQIILAFVSLYDLLGWAAFVGVAIMIFSVPLNTTIARVLKKMQEKQMKNRDKRTRLMSELLANIKSIKLYAWEYTFMRRILETRNGQELKLLRKIGIATSLNMTLWSGIPLLVAFSSFATAALVSSRPLTSDIIFPAISLFMLLQFPLAMFAQVTSNIIEAWVSVQRLSSFLKASELQPDAREQITPSLFSRDLVLSITDADFAWSSTAAKPTLEDITLSVRKGELVGVLGRVGAGKTSLLCAIIGDMTRRQGKVAVGSIAYAPQDPWILSATVRENITFFHEFDEDFYSLVLEACALTPDLALLPKGDMTEVGEKGITLSGGQRARISLARAVYARADLVLLDDCLAAVDSHVARHIFDHVIGPHGLLCEQARILVTNGVAFIKHFDQILFMRRGIILESGAYQSLITNSSSEIYKLVQGHNKLSDSVSSSGSSTPNLSAIMTPESSEHQPTGKEGSSNGTALEKTTRKGSFAKPKLVPIEAKQQLALTNVNKEHMEKGRVKVEVYRQYIEAASQVGFASFLLATVLQQAASVLASLTLRDWGEHNRETGSNTGRFKFLLVYGLFSLLSVAFGGASALLVWVYCGLRSARRLHDEMLHSLLRAPLSYFELTPTGRILNLFSRDTYVVDQILARVIQGMCRTLAVCLSILAVIGGSFPPFLVAVIPLGWFYLRVMKYYLATSRELKRLDAVSRSPIFAWFSETLSGLSTIRAFGEQSIFIAINHQRIDSNQFVGAIIIFIVALLAISALITTGVDAGLVGLVLSYALNTTSSLNWVVRSASEVEQNIVSVERILHQTKVKSEAPHERHDSLAPHDWPSAGKIVFDHYSTKYRPELDLVLKDIDITILPREKIGVCGRTGAGKSSLLLALFRIIEPVGGTIYIDDVDITKLGLHELRSAISIVPQSPDLFEGTLRENIDPVGTYSDADIWRALDQVHLKHFVESLPEALDAPVREGGSSLSAGQRQLLCFGRALLKRTKILVLDEATSAVDLETDQAIQDIIQGPSFANVTIITIAHRINTIMESTRVFVMDTGKLAEVGTPQGLMANSQSIFYSLATRAGITNDKTDTIR